MSRHLLTMIAIGLAACLGGCTDEAADEGDDAAAEETAAVPAEAEEMAAAPAAAEETAAAPAEAEAEEMVAAEAEETAAAPAAAVTEDAGDAAAITLAKLEGVDVEAGCAKCAYHIEGVTECALAMKTDGKAYIVDGTDIISDDVGLCSATRPAKVTGAATDDTRFMAKVFEFTDE